MKAGMGRALPVDVDVMDLRRRGSHSKEVIADDWFTLFHFHLTF
jgi:hypothetical protein